MYGLTDGRTDGHFSESFFEHGHACYQKPKVKRSSLRQIANFKVYGLKLL